MSLLLEAACSLQTADENYFDGEDASTSLDDGTGDDTSGSLSPPAIDIAPGPAAGIDSASTEGALGANPGVSLEGAEPSTSADSSELDLDSGVDASSATCALPLIDTQVEACGACNSGTRNRKITLTAGCTYSPGPWSECQGEVADACISSEPQSESRTCGACGTGQQTRTRTCSPDTCTWSDWSAWTACAGVTAACTPGQTSACSNGDSCGQRVCSSACTWGACAPRTPGGCLRIGPDHTDEGSNYRCCATGMWEFCLPSCEWSGNCVSCSEGAPNFCSDCYP